jgi:Uma2 family endonuclease
MSLAKKLDYFVSEEEYLAGELISDIKHEYLDGYVYAMAGASKKHNQISRNVTTRFHSSLKKTNSSCETYSSDMKIKSSELSSHFFYPDVMVVCDDSDDD